MSNRRKKITVVGGYFVGVPVKLGKEGVEEVIEIRLLPGEKAAFDASVDAVRRLVRNLPF
jgi:malate dehydrogenase